MQFRQFAGRVYCRGREHLQGLTYIVMHPQEIIRHPEWLWQRTGSTMALRVPWWPYDAISWVAATLSPGARVFEYGGGGSTLWLADRVAVVTAAEHDEPWHRQLADSLPSSVRLLFRPSAAEGIVASAAAPGFFDDYAAAISGEPDGSLDLVIVDGRARVECVRRAIPKVRPGGLLLIDDTERTRYQPAIDLLSEWERHVFTGLKPGHRAPAQTSVWRRPGSPGTPISR
jgi:hypothetical protein